MLEPSRKAFGKFGRKRHARGKSLLIAGAFAMALSFAQTATSPQSIPILEYIRETWNALTRSNRDLASAAIDPKFHRPSGGWPVYVSRTKNFRGIEQRVNSTLSREDLQTIQLRRLPEKITNTTVPGLLYLPEPYVVPGGRFNEMYGWDSYFIAMGLLRDGRVELARNMADNFLYEIREYGKILNANRSYYLTRSQPPFLTETLLDLFQRTHDREWLGNALPAIEKYYRFWTSEPHLTPETGLSRYFDLGEGPAPEVIAAETDAQGRTHYQLVKQFFRTHTVTDYDVSQYYDRAKDQLTPLFYKGDRSMRESGFDPSNRFGPFSVDVIHYNPVCLNSLLYLMEMQTGEIMDILGRKSEAERWRQRAKERADRINRLMWSAEDGLYYDYDFATRRVRKYPFLTTFYPLWAGFASAEQAARVAANLAKFERPGGLQTSTVQSGNQWDAPFGWAPLQWIAVQGLRRYGYNQDADRITIEFLSMVQEDYEKHGEIVEKYDVVRRASELQGIHFGYRSNEAGFGWTNAVFTTLLDQLSPNARQAIVGR